MNETEEKPTLPCAEKITFASEKEAKASATTAEWRYGDRPAMRPYLCRYCGLWHLTSDYHDENN